MRKISEAKKSRARMYLISYAARLRDLVEDAATEGIVLTIDRVPDPSINGKQKNVVHARLARGYY